MQTKKSYTNFLPIENQEIVLEAMEELMFASLLLRIVVIGLVRGNRSKLLNSTLLAKVSGLLQLGVAVRSVRAGTEQ